MYVDLYVAGASGPENKTRPFLPIHIYAAHTVCHKSQLSEVSFLYNFFSGKAINIENETQSTDIKNDKNRNEEQKFWKSYPVENCV